MAHHVTISAVLSLAGLILTSGSVHAQRRSYYGSSFYPPSYYPPAYYYPPVVVDPYAPMYLPSAPGEFPPLPAGTTSARIRVHLPQPDAKLLVDGEKTSSTGKSRLFHTPTLAPGGTYSYTLKATWRKNDREETEERTVLLTPGQSLVVDFNQPAAEKTPVSAPAK